MKLRLQGQIGKIESLTKVSLKKQGSKKADKLC